MNNFDIVFSNYINESVIDIPRNSLDPSVFEFPSEGDPILHPSIKMQIMQDIERLSDEVNVVRYFMIGSILTNRYTNNADIDVNVQIEPRDGMTMESLFSVLRRLNGNLAVGTTHPINYYIIKDDYDLDSADAAYDILNERWIKKPDEFDVDVQSYMDKFQSTVNGLDFSTSELRKDIIDYKELMSFDEDKIKGLEEMVEAKLREIESSVEGLVTSYKNIKSLRKQAFEKDMSPTEIRKYGRKNKLPENVIYKLLERYYYFDFIKVLKDILEDDKITSSEVDKINKAGKDLWK